MALSTVPKTSASGGDGDHRCQARPVRNTLLFRKCRAVPRTRYHVITARHRHRRRQNENRNPNHHADTGDVDMRDAFVHLTEDDTHSGSEFDSISKPSDGSGRVATNPQHMSDTAIKAMSASPQQPRKRKSQTADVSDVQGPASLLATDSTASSQAELVRHDSSTLTKVRVFTTQYRSVDLDGEQNFIKVLSTKPVTLQQLIQEIKAVYAGLGAQQHSL